MKDSAFRTGSLVGNQWPRNTVFKNRLVGSGPDAAVVVNRDKSGGWTIGNQVNWIGDLAAYFYSSPECVTGFKDCLNPDRDFDGDGTNASAAVTNMHVEKNVFRTTETCSGDPTPGRCGFHQGSPRSDTSYGTANGPGDCSGGTGDNAGGHSAPAGWNGEDIPHSLYRSSPSPPSWWCEEACPWGNVHSGIGAWGDDFDGSLCKLPAQILAEGGVGTMASGPGPGPGDSLSAPILLD